MVCDAHGRPLCAHCGRTISYIRPSDDRTCYLFACSNCGSEETVAVKDLHNAPRSPDRLRHAAA